MKVNKNDIANMNRVKRLKLINSVTGIKPANLIATRNNNGETNVAIFSSVIHLGSNPPLLGFIMRPTDDVPRNTFNNIKETSLYTINHVHPGIIERAHYTSAKFSPEISEFDICNLTEQYIDPYKVPFVKESNFKMALELKETIEIAINNTILVIGEIIYLEVPDEAFVNDDINLEASKTVGISGLNSYYELKHLNSFPYARVDEVPNFKG